MYHGQTIEIGSYEYRADALNNISQILSYMINKHNKIFACRIDVRFPQTYSPNYEVNIITEFYRRLMSYYRYHNIFAVYYSAREQDTSSNPHYHFFLLLDGNKVENAWGIREKAGSIWQALVGPGGDPCIHLCQTNEGASGIMIRRPSAEFAADPTHPTTMQFEQTKQTTLQWLSYLAKTKTKGNRAPHTKEFHGSRLK